jgi:hypothetical protein
MSGRIVKFSQDIAQFYLCVTQTVNQSSDSLKQKSKVTKNIIIFGVRRCHIDEKKSI